MAGCAAAQTLQACGKDYLLLEKHVDPGGLTRSISLGDACFDYTGHFMHLARCESPAALPFAHQNDDEWQLIERKSVVFMEDGIVPAPFQYNLFYLPEHIGKGCIDAFHSRPRIPKAGSFKEYLISGFGQGICDRFLFPYNEKVMAFALDEISTDAVKRFFPAPDEERIEKGYLKEGANLNTGYNNRFWYPKRQGIGLLAQGLARDLKALHTSCPIEGIDLASRRAYTGLGEIEYKRLLTSLPLKAFCLMTTDPSLRQIADSLRHTRVFCLNLLVRGDLPDAFAGCHWIYVPQKDLPFYRVGIYSHISSHMSPQGTTALYVESALPDDQPLPVMSQLLEQILSSLERLDWVRKGDCLLLSANWIDFAYVSFNHPRQGIVQRILEILGDHQVYPIGRYGLWDYISMEDTILSSVETARMLS